MSTTAAIPEQGQQRPITLRYIDIDRETSDKTAYLPEEKRDAIGRQAMNALNIDIPDGQSPIDAWLTAMATENKLPDQRPICGDLYYALIEDPAAFRFFFALI